MLYFPAENAAKSSGNFPQNRHLNTSKIHRKTPPKTLKKQQKNFSKTFPKNQQKNFSKPPRIPAKYPWNRPQIPLPPPKLRSNLCQNTLHQLVYSRSFSSPISARFASCFPLICNIRSERKCQNWLKNGVFSPQNRVIRHPKA